MMKDEDYYQFMNTCYIKKTTKTTDENAILKAKQKNLELKENELKSFESRLKIKEKELIEREILLKEREDKVRGLI